MQKYVLVYICIGQMLYNLEITGTIFHILLHMIYSEYMFIYIHKANIQLFSNLWICERKDLS